VIFFFLFVSRPVAEGGSSAEQDRGPAVLPERRLHHHRYPHRPQVRLLRGGKNPISFLPFNLNLN
jgi:hypothetical protein